MAASLSCTAEGLHWLWVLHSAIEKTMLKQARDNINALISFFQKEVSSGALTRQPQQQEVTSPPVSPLCRHTCSTAFNALSYVAKALLVAMMAGLGHFPWPMTEFTGCAVCLSHEARNLTLLQILGGSMWVRVRHTAQCCLIEVLIRSILLQKGKAVQHHLADVADASNAPEDQHRQPHPSDHSPAYPDSPRSVYFDAEDDAFSIDDVLSVKVCPACFAISQQAKLRSRCRRWALASDLWSDKLFASWLTSCIHSQS